MGPRWWCVRRFGHRRRTAQQLRDSPVRCGS